MSNQQHEFWTAISSKYTDLDIKDSKHRIWRICPQSLRHASTPHPHARDVSRKGDGCKRGAPTTGAVHGVGHPTSPRVCSPRHMTGPRWRGRAGVDPNPSTTCSGKTEPFPTLNRSPTAPNAHRTEVRRSFGSRLEFDGGSGPQSPWSSGWALGERVNLGELEWNSDIETT